MNSQQNDYPLTQEQIQEEINQINFMAIRRIIPSLKEIILVSKVTKLLEFSDVWHTKEKGPCFLVEEYSKDITKKKYTLIQLNQEHINNDKIVEINKDLGFGFNDEQQMLYMKKQDYTFGMWIADINEYQNFSSKMQEIIKYVKSQ